MYKSLFGILGVTLVVGYGSYKLGYRMSEAEHAGDIEKGVQIGFKSAPDIYRKMAENGDIEVVPEGMYEGEIGKVFKTYEEANLARIRHQLQSDYKRNRETIMHFKGDKIFDEFYILANFNVNRKV